MKERITNQDARIRLKVIRILGEASRKDGLGFCSAQDCKELIKRSKKWDKSQWFAMAFQLGIYEG